MRQFWRRRRRRGHRRDGRALRVAMVIQGFHPRVGGAERQLLAIVPRLRERGLDAHVVTRRYPGLVPFERVRGVPVHRIRIPAHKALASASFILGATVRLLRLRPDVIHVHELLSPATAGVLANLVSGTPVVAKILLSGEVTYLRDERPLGRWRFALFRRRISTFLSISEDIDRELREAGVPGVQRRSIPNGVDTERFAPPSPDERARLRARAGLGDGPTVAYVGRLEPQKNLRQLVEVWGHVREVHPTAELLLAGTGSDEPVLRDDAGDGVRFLGPVEDVPGLLRTADAFVLPSWREGLSNSLLEAMATGLPVVASAVGGTTGVVRSGSTGFLVAPGDAVGLESALTELLGDPELRRRFGAGARTAVVERHSLDARVEDLHDLYLELTL